MKGICFKEPLFNQIIQGKKTLTMRTGDLKPINKKPDTWTFLYQIRVKQEKLKLAFRSKKRPMSVFLTSQDVPLITPRFQPHEIVYLKEPYSGKATKEFILTIYKYAQTSMDARRYGANWKNKLFMPEKHARYFIWIKNINVKRCNDLTEEEIIKEGLNNGRLDPKPFNPKDRKVINKINDPKWNWKNLWISINGKTSWKKNEWAIQYEFECGVLSRKGKDFKGKKLHEGTPDIGLHKVVYNNFVYSIGNRRHQEVELYIGTEFIRTTTFSEIQLFKPI